MACITNMPRTHYIGVSAGGDFEADPVLDITKKLAIVSNSHVWTPEFVEDDSHRGTIWTPSEGVVYNRGMGSGPVVLRPRANDFRTLLPLLIGGTFSTNTITPGIICNFFRMMADKSVAVLDHKDCKTNSWTLSSSSGSPILQLEWNIESCKFSIENAGSFTSGLDFSVMPPFVHSKSTVTIGGVEYKVDDVSISGSNNLGTDIFYNSQTRTDLSPGNQTFTFTHSSPFDVDADIALLELGATSVTGSVVYTAGATNNLSLTISFPALHAPVVTPITAAGNTPTRYEGIQWTARTTGTGGSLAKPIQFVLDDTA
jgi:hypothetical protein